MDGPRLFLPLLVYRPLSQECQIEGNRQKNFLVPEWGPDVSKPDTRWTRPPGLSAGAHAQVMPCEVVGVSCRDGGGGGMRHADEREGAFRFGLGIGTCHSCGKDPFELLCMLVPSLHVRWGQFVKGPQALFSTVDLHSFPTQYHEREVGQPTAAAANRGTRRVLANKSSVISQKSITKEP